MSYFKTSYATLQAIARGGRYEDLAGFLVLARHASGLHHAGFEPYKLSGAGVNGIREKAGLSEESARGVIERLQELGVIRPASAETRKAFFHARWEIIQKSLDLALPHSLVDAAKGTPANAALRRLKDTRIADPGYADQLGKVSDTELRLDAVTMLLAIYRYTSMLAYGGLDPKCLRRVWEVKSRASKLGGVRWGAEPGDEITHFWFMNEVLQHAVSSKAKDAQPSAEVKVRFWNAWRTMRLTGLVYEAVALYDADLTNDKARLRLTLRVNDYHAGASTKTGDPSLLRTLEATSGSRFAYYTPSDNERGEAEAMWVVLPDSRGALVGVWRARFRPATNDVGAWVDQENDAIEAVAQSIYSAASEA